jgi:uncharacterized protein YbdZ (MbtH family)
MSESSNPSTTRADWAEYRDALFQAVQQNYISPREAQWALEDFMRGDGRLAWLGHAVENLLCLRCGHSLMHHDITADRCGQCQFDGRGGGRCEGVYLKAGYRQMLEGEILERGDEYWNSNIKRWTDTQNVGERVDPAFSGYIKYITRRPLPESGLATREEIRERVDRENGTVSVQVSRVEGNTVTFDRLPEQHSEQHPQPMFWDDVTARDAIATSKERGLGRVLRGDPKYLLENSASLNIPQGWKKVAKGQPIEKNYQIWNKAAKRFVPVKKKAGYMVLASQYVIRPKTDREKVLEMVFEGQASIVPADERDVESIRLRDLELEAIEIPEGWELVSNGGEFTLEMRVWDYVNRKFLAFTTPDAAKAHRKYVETRAAIVIRPIKGYRFFEII